VKLDLVMAPTVPDAPPEAGPDRALDPPPPNPGLPEEWLLDTSCFADADWDVARPKESPITAAITVAVTIHPPLFFQNNRRTLGQRSCLAMGVEFDQSGEEANGGGSAEPAPPVLPSTDGPDVAPDTR
jgi:hypothetical protein